MDINYAKEIITALSNGVNPVTREILPSDSVFNEPDVIRALYTAVEALASQEKKELKSKPENAGKRWTDEDDNLLEEMFYKRCSQKEICERFGRTRSSVAARLVKLGKIQSTDEIQGTSENFV